MKKQLDFFDLNRFRNGENTVDNFGNEHKFISLQEDAREDQCLVTLCVNTGKIHCFDINGIGPFSHYLKMKKPTKHEGYINIYMCINGHFETDSFIHPSERVARQMAGHGQVAVVKITFYETEGL